MYPEANAMNVSKDLLPKWIIYNNFNDFVLIYQDTLHAEIWLFLKWLELVIVFTYVLF